MATATAAMGAMGIRDDAAAAPSFTSGAPHDGPTEVTFIAATGQRDNVGDSLLRRPMLASANTARPRYVLIGEEADDYATNLGLLSTDRTFVRREAWLLALIRHSARRRTTLIMNSGEVVVNARFILDRILMTPVIALIRARGGRVAQTGIGIRRPQNKTRVLRSLLRTSSLVTWRDEPSRDCARTGRVTPDWAFHEGATVDELVRRMEHASQDQRTLVLSMRADSPLPSGSWIREMRQTLTDLEATAVVVCQVRRDRERCAWLAEALEADFVDWVPEATHFEQEAAVRKVYAQSTWVTSDRLHVLIAAFTEGCVPLDLIPDSGAKIARTFAPVGDFPKRATGAAPRLSEDQKILLETLATARSRIKLLREELSRAS